MRKRKITLLPLVLAIFLFGPAMAQESINTAGGDASGLDGSVSFSVGQVVYTAISGAEGTVTQGVQHAYEISAVGINQTEINISLNAFPNPTTEYLTLRVKNLDNEKLTYLLHDSQGKLLKTGLVKSQETTIPMKEFANATYFINVVNGKNKKIQSFKIIKH